MRTFLARLVLCVIIAAAPAVVDAASPLRGIMHTWRADARTAADILSGRAPFDEGTVRNVLQGYASDATRIAAGVTAQTAEARDFKHRFMTFAADAQAALGDLPRRQALADDFNRLVANCRSCHDTYND